MFSKKSYVMHYVNGLCLVDDVVKPVGVDYDCLVVKPVYANNSTFVLYIPLEKAEKCLRKTISREQAEEILEEFASLKLPAIEGAKLKSAEYKNMLYSNNPKNLAILSRELYSRINKGNLKYSIDMSMLTTATKLLEEELAFALNTDVEEVKQLLLQKTKQ